MARPKKKIDEKQVENLAAINCSVAEMAAVLDCDKRTLERRFAAAIEKGRERGTMSLKRKQYEVAMNGNVSMLIWLGKIVLKQREVIEQRVESKVEDTTQSERVKALAKELWEAAQIKNELK